VLTAGYAAITFHELRAYYMSYKQRKLPRHNWKNSSHSDDEKVANLPSPTTIPSSHIELPRSSSLAIPISENGIEPSAQPSTLADPKDRYRRNRGATKAHRPRRKQWSGNWDPMLLGIAAFQFVVFTYFIVSTELLLQWNPYQIDGNKWGFGQVWSCLLMFYAIVHVVFRSWP
jgi:hypothetical protein